jgi:hypothetical protein
LSAFDGEVAVGWCQLTPHTALPWFDRDWRVKRVDEVPVWGIILFLRADRLSQARCYGCADRCGNKNSVAREGSSPGGLSVGGGQNIKRFWDWPTGYATTFARAGFHTVACHFPPRPIMRRDLNVTSRHCSRGP